MPRWSVGRCAPPRPTTRPRARRSIPEGPAATRRLRRPPQRWPPHRELAGSFPKARTGAAGIVVRHDRYSQRLYDRHDQRALYSAGLGRTDRSAKTAPTPNDPGQTCPECARFGDQRIPDLNKRVFGWYPCDSLELQQRSVGHSVISTRRNRPSRARQTRRSVLHEPLPRAVCPLGGSELLCSLRALLSPPGVDDEVTLQWWHTLDTPSL